MSTSLAEILELVEQGKLSAKEAQAKLNDPNTLENFANLDHHRHKRAGFPEAVFGEGKTPKQIAAILDDLARVHKDSESQAEKNIIATRVTPDMFAELSNYTISHGVVEYHETARIVTVKTQGAVKEPIKGKVVVVTAGTTDVPVAEEVAVTLEAAGCEVDRINDAGVAGLHRIVRSIPRLCDPDVRCVVVCAGMDGALPSVVGGLVRTPVIAVPTSIGYGASFSGIAALMTMLNSCSPGVGVVNIDNGFGAAIMAFKMIHAVP